MSKISKFLRNEYVNAYDLSFKKQYSEPKIYDAGGDLSKRWYVYYSFRNPETDKLERQTPIYEGINTLKTYRERKKAITILRLSVKGILETGNFNPFIDTNSVDQVQKLNIIDSVNFVLKLKENTLKDNSYKDFKTRINQFKNWLLDNGFKNRYITAVNKKAAITYLNEISTKSSAKNRNNSRSVLSMFFQSLEDNEIIADNFIKKINVLKTNPERNKTYSSKQENDLFNYLIKHDQILLLFIQFVSYNHLRPIEVVRLKIGDVNVNDKVLYVRAKNKAVKIKLIPEILLSKLPDISNINKDFYLFTPNDIGADWQTNETDKRNYFGKRFKKVKDSLGLGSDYGLYSFRHTFITKLYNSLLIDSTPFEAKSRLMLITGHTTMTALDKYLRDIDAVLPDDYSKHIEQLE
ncbi:tyrosine-type recombinase/integrase [Flavobacterium sp.]|uniref:tyrosine-type recombinase/integrase n=1 Tax=Flavobacterium sp. TaxID=239 RepID=UPI00375098FD